MLKNTSATLLSTTLVLLCATGCSTTSDPDKGGLMGGIQGLSSGAYEQRVQERNDRLSRLKKATADLKAEKTALKRTKRAKVGTYRQQRRKLKDISRRLLLAARNIETDKNTYAKRQQQISRLQARIDMILKSLDRSENNKSRVNRKVDNVESDYKDLLGLPN